jgi:hypothetical protein
MSLPTNPSFDANNLVLTKHPLYLVVIEGLPEPLTTFRVDEARVTWHGYGLIGYGHTGYGY